MDAYHRKQDVLGKAILMMTMEPSLSGQEQLTKKWQVNEAG